MELGLRDKKVVVTGASKGIGYAIAQEFLREGSKVVISGRNEAELGAAVEELGKCFGKERIQGFALDGTKEKDTDELARLAAGEDGKIAVWINNIGTNRARKGEYYTEEEIDYLIGMIFKSAVFGTQAAARYMKKTGGSIVNVASLAARIATCGKSTIYASMKSAIIGLTETTAGEYATYGIRVNAVMPGYTKTPLIASTFTQKMLDELMADNLLRRMAEPVEIARPVVFLASDMASYVTASSLEISGGHNKVLNPEYSYQNKDI